jgi:Domain of unknown function (DUF4326)
MPKVLNMRGRRGVVPDGAVYVRKSAGPFRGPCGWFRRPESKWANPYKFDREGTCVDVIAKYREHLLSEPDLMAALPELRGKDLAGARQNPATPTCYSRSPNR